MLLDSIAEPADVRSLSPRQLVTLCEELREFIIDTVNTHGGHLGSNLGIVELTVALHRVLDSPNDVVLFDTGHQAYVHKLLTGRKDGFAQLKRKGGVSGYPSQAESDHDWIENSHASTVLSYAHGLATAFAQQQSPDNPSNRRVVAVIGDGSLTGGMAYEGLNNLGHSGSNVTIILNDNGRSYAPTISHLTDSLVKIRSNPVYMKRQRRLEHFTARLPFIGKYSMAGIRASKAAIREAFEPQAFFEPLGVRYMGPFDGHDIAELETALTNAEKFSGPVVLHVQTQKGRGFAPAENDTIKAMHDTSGDFLAKEEPAAGSTPVPAPESETKTPKPYSYTDAFTESLVKLADEHDDLVAITAAMPDSTGLLPFRERFPERCVDVGIAEQHAVTMAAGMAMGGLRPVFAVYSTFLSRAFDQVNLDVALHNCPVIFCLDRAGVTGNDGPSHHGILDMVLLSKVPGMTIFAPSSYQELQQMMHDAYAITDGPVCIRWPKTPAPSVPDDQVGRGVQARKARSGTDVCLIGVGKMLGAALQAADELEAEGISCTVWDPRAAKPLDPAMLDDAGQFDFVVTAEDGLVDGGIGSTIARELRHTGARVETLGVPTEFIPHNSADAILAELGLDGPGIAATVRRYRS